MRRSRSNRIDNISSKMSKKQTTKMENASRAWLNSKDLSGKSIRDGYAEYGSQQIMRLTSVDILRIGIVGSSLRVR